MSVKEILERYLHDHGYDGLCGCECGCSLAELITCDEWDISQYTPGYNNQKKANGLGCYFWMQTKKPT